MGKINSLLLAIMVLVATSAWADDWPTVKSHCRNAKDAPGFYTVADCAASFFQLVPVGPEIKSIAPGSQLGLGLHGVKNFNRGRIQSNFRVVAIYSLNHSNLLEGRYELYRPTFGQSSSATATLEDQIRWSVFGRRFDLEEQAFYGLGPDTPVPDRSLYRQRTVETGTSISIPLLSWLVTGGSLRFLDTAIKGQSNTSQPVTTTVFSGVPGVIHADSYLTPGLFIDFRTPTHTRYPSFRNNLQVNYSYFSDLDGRETSFHRWEAQARSSNDIRHHLARRRGASFWKDLVCMRTDDPKECSFGTVVLDGLVTASYASNENAIPFFLQPTLGGTDQSGTDTLRGLVDYRLRAPNRVLLQAEIDKDVYSPVGIMAFYDTGKVALTPGDLALSHLRHDFGVGLYLKANNKILIRAFIAFGAGEGSKMNYKLPSALAQ